MMMGFGFFGLVLMLLFWGVLIGLAVWAVGALFPTPSRLTEGTTHNLTAQQIVDLRYARGELSREQYDLMKQDLS
jgi:putative membrane protein